MTTTALLIATTGLLLIAGALVLRARERRAQLLELLELPYAEDELEHVEHLADRTGLLEPSIGAVGRVLERMEVGEQLAKRLERARVPLRPGEVVLGTAAGAAGFGVWGAALTGQLVFAPVFAAIVPVVVNVLLTRRIEQRRRLIEQELPGALSMLASSLEAGHTLARAMDLMAGETNGPLAEEFTTCLAETRLGAPLTDAMERMAARVELEDLEWVVQAVRIQQSVGGKLSDLLHTLAEYMLAREEIRREVSVLTAEGRMSAWILALLPVGVAAAIQLTNPGYLKPLIELPGVLFLGYAVVSVAIGVAITRRLVRSIEL